MFCRKDLNDPPTAVGGIKQKGRTRGSGLLKIDQPQIYAWTAMYFSIIRVIDSLLVAPTTRSTSLPSRKRISVGMPLIPYRCAVDGLSSTFSFTTLALSP